MGVYLQAVDGPDIDSPDYIGTHGGSQSNVILKLIRYYQTVAHAGTNMEQFREAIAADKNRKNNYRDDGRIIHCIEWFKIVNREAPADPYEFRKYVIDRGVLSWLQVTQYDDDHVTGVRAAISKIAEYGQDVYET